MATFPFKPVNGVIWQSITFRDAKGNTGRFGFFMDCQAAASGTAIQTDLNTVMATIPPLTFAAVQRFTGYNTEYGVAQYGAHASGGAYESIIDKAVMVFQDAAGQLHRYEIPAPKVAIFKNDKITVDPANSAVAAFTAAFSTVQAGGCFVCSRQDIALANFMGGVYKARKLHRRLNILVLEPDLTPSLPAE